MPPGVAVADVNFSDRASVFGARQVLPAKRKSPSWRKQAAAPKKNLLHVPLLRVDEIRAADADYELPNADVVVEDERDVSDLRVRLQRDRLDRPLPRVVRLAQRFESGPA